MFRIIAKKFLELTYKPLILWYLSKERAFRYQTLRFTVIPGVFHPLVFFSTRVLLDYLSGRELNGKKFAEPGCGTGFLSVHAARLGADVFAFDKNPDAVENTKRNALENNVVMRIEKRDISDGFGNDTFDMILINPPYYPKDPGSDAELAWFCGKEFGYFQHLFRNLQGRIHSNSEIIMVLSQDCDIPRIGEIANQNNFTMQILAEKRNILETNYLFRILPGKT